MCGFSGDDPDPPCIRACPKDAISLSPLKIDSSRCNGCMMCAAACLGDALVAGRGFLGALSGAAMAQEGTEVLIRCSRIFADACEAACLAVLDVPFLVELALKSGKDIRLLKGDCGDCDMSACRGLADKSINDSNALLSICGSSRRVLAVLADNGRHDDARLSRRRVFSAIGAVVSRHMPEEEGFSEATHGFNRKKRRILEFIEGLPVDARARITEFYRFYGKTIDSEACDGCAGSLMCVRLCPSRSLTFVLGSDGDASGIVFVPATCAGCGVCTKACGKKAIRPAQTPITAFDEALSARRLVSFKTLRCGHCEALGIALRDGLCLDCRQRLGKLNWDPA